MINAQKGAAPDRGVAGTSGEGDFGEEMTTPRRQNATMPVFVRSEKLVWRPQASL